MTGSFDSYLLVALGSYLLGSLSFAVLVSRAFGLADPRSYGSGNPGATNVMRTGNKAAAILTLVGDGAKGWVALELARVFGGTNDPEWVLACAALSVFLGHLFPLFFHFRGGKGVATALGVLLGYDLWLGLATLATWLAIFVFFRLSSFAALIAALFAPFYSLLLFGPRPFTVALAPLSLLLIWRHRANIQSLLAGKEKGFRPKRNDS